MAFAGSDAHAGNITTWVPLSAEWAYFHALKHDGSTPHAGLTMRAMLASLKTDGQPPEVEWPYIDYEFTDFSAWKPPSTKNLLYCNSKVLVGSFDAIASAISAGEHVLMTMSISPAFRYPDTDGIVNGVEPIEPARVHAIVGVGLAHDSVQRYLLVRNSWGPGWGLNGYAWLSETYAVPRILRAATLL